MSSNPSPTNGETREKTKKAGAKSKIVRPSWSCTECTRRKIKCDQVLPCQQCVKRGLRDSCHSRTDSTNSLVTVNGISSLNSASIPGGRVATSTELSAIRSSIVELKHKIHALETLMAQFTPEESVDPDGKPVYPSGTAKGNSTVVKTPPQGISPKPANERKQSLMTPMNPESDNEVEAAVTLEYLALGRDRTQDHLTRGLLLRPEGVLSNIEATDSIQNRKWSLQAPAVSSPNDGSRSESITAQYPIPSSTSLLVGYPNKEQSDAIVKFSLEELGWQHAAVHVPTFLSQCEQFFSWGDNREALVNRAWLALYTAVLCVGVKHMQPEQISLLGISSLDSSKNIAQFLFDRSINALYAADFLSKHSIFSVQTIVILVMTCQDVGGSDLIATLLATAIRISISLNIHRFPSDAEWEHRLAQRNIDPHSPEGIKSLVDREVKKRLWCALSTEDWISTIPYRRTFSISPAYTTTPLPLNVRDEDLAAGLSINRPMSEYTPASKLLLNYAVASCIRRYFETAGSSDGPSYTTCLEVDREIRTIMSEAPQYLQLQTDISLLPLAVQSMRNYWYMSTRHKLLILHHGFLARAFREPEFAYSRQITVVASREILRQFAVTPRFPQLWTASYHCISAANHILLEIFHAGSCGGASGHQELAVMRNEVEISIRSLSLLSPSSPIASRGVQLLTTLLEELDKQQPFLVSLNGKRTGDSLNDDPNKRIKLEDDNTLDMQEFSEFTVPSSGNEFYGPLAQTLAQTEGFNVTNISAAEAGILGTNVEFWKFLDPNTAGPPTVPPDPTESATDFPTQFW